MRSSKLTVLFALAICVPAAASSGTSIKLDPSRVDAGQRVHISGSAGDCPAGNRVTLISRAFSRRHEFAGVPAVYARVMSNGRYSVSPRIPSRRKPDRYSVTGRCGGANMGVRVTLRVTSP